MNFPGIPKYSGLEQYPDALETALDVRRNPTGAAVVRQCLRVVHVTDKSRPQGDQYTVRHLLPRGALGLGVETRIAEIEANARRLDADGASRTDESWFFRSVQVTPKGLI